MKDLLLASLVSFLFALLLFSIASRFGREQDDNHEPLTEFTCRELVTFYSRKESPAGYPTNKNILLRTTGMQRSSNDKYVWRERAGDEPWVIVSNISSPPPARIIALCKGPREDGTILLVMIRPVP